MKQSLTSALRLAPAALWGAVALLATGLGCASAPEPPPEVPARPATSDAPELEPPPAALGAVERAEPRAPVASSIPQFLHLGRGDRVADLGSGVGYSILAFVDAVGPSGVVHTRHDPRLPSDLPAESPAAAAESLPENLVLLHTALDAPLSADARGLDEVAFLFGYADLLASARDRSAFHRVVFRALKPGGTYVLGEHGMASSSTERGSSERVPAQTIRSDVEAAGFVFVEAADFVPARQLGAGPSSVTPGSQYLLAFRKPR